MEHWKEIPEFPGYSVSDMGHVRNDETGYLLTLLQNREGVVNVGMIKDKRQYKRAVALLVARAFLDPPSPPAFDTPINLDGDRTNNDVTNLMWRPRWFAIAYARQFHTERKGIRVPIEDVNTGEHYRNSWAAATQLGLLDKEILLAIMNHTYVWPTYQIFRVKGNVDIGQ